MSRHIPALCLLLTVVALIAFGAVSLAYNGRAMEACLGRLP